MTRDPRRNAGQPDLETRGYIRIRTPDDRPGAWTAEGDIQPGQPYTYTSGDVAVTLDWLDPDPLYVPEQPVQPAPVRARYEFALAALAAFAAVIVIVAIVLALATSRGAPAPSDAPGDQGLRSGPHSWDNGSAGTSSNPDTVSPDAHCASPTVGVVVPGGLDHGKRDTEHERVASEQVDPGGRLSGVAGEARTPRLRGDLLPRSADQDSSAGVDVSQRAYPARAGRLSYVRQPALHRDHASVHRDASREHGRRIGQGSPIGIEDGRTEPCREADRGAGQGDSGAGSDGSVTSGAGTTVRRLAPDSDADREPGSLAASDVTAVTRQGVITHNDDATSRSYLALPCQRNGVHCRLMVTICGPAACLDLRQTDYGPSQRLHPDRIADVHPAVFERLCGCPASRGVTVGTWTAISPAVTLPPTDTRREP